MILGIGTDFCYISRIKEIYDKHPAFAKKLLTFSEFEDFQNTKEKDVFLTKIWACKEAFAKASYLGISKMGFQNISVKKSSNGSLYYEISNELNFLICKNFNQNKINSFLSISHEKDFLIAFAVIEEG